jgi:hypothetical protein
MKTYSRNFTNELGHSAIVRANEETRHDVPGVLLFFTGSNADTEVFLTKQEAIEMLEALSAVLKRRR